VTEPAATEPARKDGWKLATVHSLDQPTPRVLMMQLFVPDRAEQLPGQHYVIRLTAPDGYTASRSYSVASSPAERLVELGIELLEDGEVSGYLGDVVVVGDQLEVRGPIGLWFVWRGDRRAVAIGGGSGVVPLVSMLRHAKDIGRLDQLHLAVSARRPEELLFHDELTESAAVVAYTRSGAVGASSGGRALGRLSADDIAPLIGPDTTYYICGSAAFTEAMSQLLVSLGVDAADVRVERFGPSGADS
jgi:ferredoxin-NADP reductase